MAEREDLREREETQERVDPSAFSLSDQDVGGPSTEVDLSDLESDAEADDVAPAARSSSRFDLGIRSGLRSRLGTLFDTGSFVLGLVLSVVGLLVVGGLLPLGGLGDLVGIGAATFAYGLVSEKSHYVEMAVAGAAVGGAWSFLGNLLIALLGVGAPVVAVGLAGGGLAAALGHYFGRDLRDGLTREV